MGVETHPLVVIASEAKQSASSPSSRAKRGDLPLFRFQIISVVPALGGSCWVREYWRS